MKYSKAPYVRDVYLAYLIQGARRTAIEGYPVIEPWMVAKEPPKDIVQWDKRSTVKNKTDYAISFYCKDQYFSSLQCNPKKYTDEVQAYQCVIGMDASPFDNMPPVVQKSQIYDNLAITYYFGRQGIPVIPNVRIGTSCTLDSLDAYPEGTLIAIGSNGFTHELFNREVFEKQFSVVVEKLRPSGVLFYGPVSAVLGQIAEQKGILIYQYDSFMKKRYNIRKAEGGKV